ncbi:MAG: protein phosphatase CheZ [Pseudomonadota bacterium]
MLKDRGGSPAAPTAPQGGEVQSSPASAPVGISVGEVRLAVREEVRGLVDEMRGLFLDEVRESLKQARSELHQTDKEAENAAQELLLVKTEVRALSHAIQDTKKEIAALVETGERNRRIEVVKDELGSVVKATEDATEKIMAAMEEIDSISTNIRATAATSELQAQADEIMESVVKVFEACNFQDLTGQRINKVVNTMKYIEERLSSILDIWGEDDFDELEKPPEPKGMDDLDKTLPRTTEATERVSQDDIDKMFG